MRELPPGHSADGVTDTGNVSERLVCEVGRATPRWTRRGSTAVPPAGRQETGPPARHLPAGWMACLRHCKQRARGAHFRLYVPASSPRAPADRDAPHEACAQGDVSVRCQRTRLPFHRRCARAGSHPPPCPPPPAVCGHSHAPHSPPAHRACPSRPPDAPARLFCVHRWWATNVRSGQSARWETECPASSVFALKLRSDSRFLTAAWRVAVRAAHAHALVHGHTPCASECQFSASQALDAKHSTPSSVHKHCTLCTAAAPFGGVFVQRATHLPPTC
jgi:hypothetical protein